MRRCLVGAAALLIGAASTPAEAIPDCRAPGAVVSQGETLCIAVGERAARLARCSMVLNTSSWEFLVEPCSVSTRKPVPANGAETPSATAPQAPAENR
jgi:hypothetical protein